jgi:hypothetical protein
MDDFEVIDTYRWYSTPKFYFNVLGNQPIELHVKDVYQSKQLYVDKIMLVKVGLDFSVHNNHIVTSRQMTDPNDPDTDGDKLFDGSEVKIDSGGPNIYWFESEHFASKKQSFKYDSKASNYYALEPNENNADLIYSIDKLPHLPSTSTYTIIHRVKWTGEYKYGTSSFIRGFFYGKLSLRSYQNGWISQSQIFGAQNLENTEYEWIRFGEFSDQNSDEFQILMQGCEVYIDKIILVRNPSPITITDPLDPDSDLDSISDHNEIQLDFRTSANNDYDVTGTWISVNIDHQFKLFMYQYRANFEWSDDELPSGLKYLDDVKAFGDYDLYYEITSNDEYIYIDVPDLNNNLGWNELIKFSRNQIFDAEAKINGMKPYPLITYKNKERKKYWLNPIDKDCDDDGLLDREEIKVTFKTNAKNGYYDVKSTMNPMYPLTPPLWISIDTDGDGKLEGYRERSVASQISIRNGITNRGLISYTPEGFSIRLVDADVTMYINGIGITYVAPAIYIVCTYKTATGGFTQKCVYYYSEDHISSKLSSYIPIADTSIPVLKHYVTNFELIADPLIKDTDIDGIWDGVEVKEKRYDIDYYNPPSIDLFGEADPLIQDIFIEVDWMKGTLDCYNHGYTDLNNNGLFDFTESIIDSFDSQGIVLHIDHGLLIGGDIDGDGYSGDENGGGSVPHVYNDMSNREDCPEYNGDTNCLVFDDRDSPYYSEEAKPLIGPITPPLLGSHDEFSDYKTNYFDSNREDIFHYCVLSHYVATFAFLRKSKNWPSCFTIVQSKGNVRGIANFKGDDFCIEDKTLKDEDSNCLWYASTFMHELGHNLGLEHIDRQSYLPFDKNNIPEIFDSCMLVDERKEKYLVNYDMLEWEYIQKINGLKFVGNIDDKD